MNKAYILTFDKGGIFDRFDYLKFHQQLIKTPNIVDWFHYLENSYILIIPHHIKSNYISDIWQNIGNKRFSFVCELDINNCNGWLPAEAWEWIKKFQSPPNFFNRGLV